jgi:hypothetical protein
VGYRGVARLPDVNSTFEVGHEALRMMNPLLLQGAFPYILYCSDTGSGSMI